MILGIYDPSQSAETLREMLQAALSGTSRSPLQQTQCEKSWAEDAIALAWTPTGISTLDEPTQPYHTGDLNNLNDGLTKARTVSVFEGKLYNLSEIQAHLEPSAAFTPETSGRAIGELYERGGEDWLAPVNGKFSFALWDRQAKSLILGRDRLGIQSLFYTGGDTSSGQRLVFSSSLKTLLRVSGIAKQLDHQAVIDYLLYCYNPGNNTFFKGIYKLPASHLLKVGPSSRTLHQYWHLSFAAPKRKSEAQYCEEIPALITDAVQLRIDRHQSPGVLLSGGIDSSTMVGLSAQILADRVSEGRSSADAPIVSANPALSTFSFRCQGKSYDESQYARLIATHFHTQHNEVSYEPSDLTEIATAAAAMDEPFCDIGIEIATFLLGRAAEDKVSYVFSGEGGDELFGGHPVYTADKTAAYIDLIPQSLLRPITARLQKIPDTDQKNNLQVKLKRVAYSLAFPPELLSHRWRIYYTASELKALCTDTLLSHQSEKDLSKTLFDTMLKRTDSEVAAGPDILSRCLSSDYWTLVNFYLRRLALLRQFGIENRLPLLDHRLVEYAATIPSDLKLRGLSDTKYIYKQALRGILPDEILFNRPKLGHSVPMKNWMREQPAVQDWITDILSSDTFNRRGLFNPAFVQQLLTEHFQKTHNHSHRLWALVVLEFWLRDAIDELT